MALQPTKLIVAFLTLIIILVCGKVMDLSYTVVALEGVKDSDIISLPEKKVYLSYPTELHCFLAEPDEVDNYKEKSGAEANRLGVFDTMWHFGSARFHDSLVCLLGLDMPGVIQNMHLYARAVRWAVTHHTVYAVIFFLIKLSIISLAGGAICRLSALQFARDEKPGLVEAVRFSFKKFAALLTAPVVPIGIIALIGLVIFVIGVIGNIPWIGEIVIGISLLIALVCGFLISLVLVGTIGGFSLMYPAVAFEVSDGFDAISRSFRYLYTRPWRIGFYSLVATIYGSICYLFVRLLVFLLLWSTYGFLQVGLWVDSSSKGLGKLAAIWPEPEFFNLLGTSGAVSQNWSESFASVLISITLFAALGLLVAFVISFYFSANTIIYALLRHSVDQTELDEVSTFVDDIEEIETINSSVESM